MGQVEAGLEILRPPKLSKDAFKALIIGRGWRMADAAFRWGVRPETLSRAAGDESRDLRWDDLVRSLPQLDRRQRAAATAARLHQNPAKVRNRQKLTSATVTTEKTTIPTDHWFDDDEPNDQYVDGFRYREYVDRGSELVVMMDIGEFASEGMTLVVVKTRAGVDDHGGATEEYLCRTPENEEMWLTPDQMDDWVVSTGRTRPVDL